MIQIEKLIEFFEDHGFLRKSYHGKKVEHIKPRHGNCCTCQVCGYAHEDCVCEHNELINWLETNKIEEKQNDK